MGCNSAARTNSSARPFPGRWRPQGALPSKLLPASPAATPHCSATQEGKPSPSQAATTPPFCSYAALPQPPAHLVPGARRGISPLGSDSCPNSHPIPATILPRILAPAHLVPVALKVVVKGQLLARRHVPDRKQPDGQLAVHQPLLGLAVGVARVVDEPAQPALRPAGRAGVEFAPSFSSACQDAFLYSCRPAKHPAGTRRDGPPAKERHRRPRKQRGLLPPLAFLQASMTSPLPIFMKYTWRCWVRIRNSFLQQERRAKPGAQAR